MAETMYINLDLRGGHLSEKGELEDYRHFIDIDNLKFIFKYGGKEYAIGGSDSIKDVAVTFASNQFSVSDNLDLSKKYISLRFKAPAELILTDNPTLIINSNIYTIESGYFKAGDIVICNLDNEGRKAFFRNIDGEEVIVLTGVKTLSDDGSITVSWDNVTNNNIKGYYITYGTHIPSNINDGVTIKVDNKTMNSYTINGLENDTEYFIMITPYTKRNIFTSNKYVSDVPFSGYLLKDVPLGSVVKSNDGSMSFYVCDNNHYGNNGTTLLAKEKYTTAYPVIISGKKTYFKNFTNLNDSLSLYLSELQEKNISPLTTSIDFIEETGTVYKEQYVFLLSVNEYNGIFQANNLTSPSTPMTLFADVFTPTNASNDFRNNFVPNNIITRDKGNASDSSMFWWVNDTGRFLTTGLSLKENQNRYQLQPAFNVDSNLKCVKNEDGTYTLK